MTVRYLSHILQTEKILPVDRVIDLLVALLRSRLNNSDIHGQITPDRVLIVGNLPSRVKILPPDRISADPEFSAPEILNGQTSNSSDIYSIGLIGIYLLTGIRPFQLFDTTNHTWVWQDYWWQPPVSSEINYPKLVDILDRAIAENPENRFSSTQEMIAALQDCYPTLSPPAPNWDCRYILTGHQGLFAAITAIAISPTRSIVATGSEDRTIRLWDIDTGKQIGILTGHQRAIATLVFHPLQGDLFFSSGQDGHIKLWQIERQQELISIASQQTKVNSLAISPNGRLLASGGSDRTIKIWHLNLDTFTAIEDSFMTLKHHRLGVNGVAFNPSVSEVTFASVSSDRTVMLWGLHSSDPLAIFTAHTQAVRTVAFSPNGKLLATAGDDGLIQIWDIPNRQLQQTLSAHRWRISALSFWHSNILISASWDGSIKFWRIDGGVLIDCVAGHDAEILDLAVTRDERYIITASRDRTAKIFLH